MASYEWRLVTFRSDKDDYPHVDWELEGVGTKRRLISGSDKSLKLTISFQCDTVDSTAPTIEEGWLEVWDDMRGWVRHKNLTELSDDFGGRNTMGFDYHIEIPYTKSPTIFRLTDIRMKDWGVVLPASSHDRPSKVFGGLEYEAAETILGGFTIDYLPLTILYSPPGRNMKNWIGYDRSYGTLISLGYPTHSYIAVRSCLNLTAGLQLKTPDPDGKLDDGRSLEGVKKYSALDRFSSVFFFNFDCVSSLCADNESAIDPPSFGPLGDLFVLLKNGVHVQVVGGDFHTVAFRFIPDPKGADPEIIVVPAHALLATNDPSISSIPASTRKAILEMDPFLLDDLSYFFDEHPVIMDRTKAVKIGWVDLTTRGVDIARLRLVAGSEIDLQERPVELEEARRLADVLHVQLSNVAGALDEILPGVVFRNLDGAYCLKAKFWPSFEALNKRIKGARCHLVHDDVEEASKSIEVLWDKIFSTYMFRKAWPSGTIVGTIEGQTGIPVGNAPVFLSYLGDPGESHVQLSDQQGRFAFKNVARNPGTYELKCGNATGFVKVTRKSVLQNATTNVKLKNVKRIVNVRSFLAEDWIDQLNIPESVAADFEAFGKSKGRVNSKSFARFLSRYGLSLSKLSKDIVFEYNLPSKKANTKGRTGKKSLRPRSKQR